VIRAMSAHELSIDLADEPSPEELSIVERGLAEHGEARSEPRNARPLVLFLRDAGGDVVGGLRAATVWGWLEIKWLWIAERHRGLGYGRRLVAAAEREAVGRGCRHAWLDTFDFQAPQFYARLGYDVFAALDDFPRAHTRYFLCKMALPPSA